MAARRSDLADNSPTGLLEQAVKRALITVKKARKHRQNLTADHFYGNKLAEVRADAANAFRDLQSRSAGDTTAMAELIQTVFSATASKKARNQAASDLTFSLRTTWRNQPVQSAATLDHCSKGYIRFVPQEWNTIADLNKGEGWTPTKRILLFQFFNSPPNLFKLSLYIGPCEQGAEKVREKLFDASKANREVFRKTMKSLSPKWSLIWSQGFLTRRDFDEAESEELEEKVQEKWKSFLTHDLPALVTSVNGVFGR